MLTLKLTLHNGQVTVRANEAQSHSFSLHDLRLNDAELKAFVLNPRLYGSRLFQALFKDDSVAKSVFDELSKQTARTIVLVLDSPELDSVAWEYGYNEGKQEYVVEDCAFMRALPESERPANGRLKESVERVSLLFIPANPLVDLNAKPMHALDVDGEWREMTRHITASHAPFDLLQLRPATPEQLQTSMARFRDGLAVHFSGHGAAMKDGTILLFERENGASNPLGAQEFIRTVKDKAGIVFLSACQSAAAEKTEFGNLARGLVKSGVPFALGMQFNLPDPFAPVISGQFYNWLAQGHAIPEATMQARRAVKREHEFFVGMIALYAAHPDETGKLDWRGSVASLAQAVRPADVSDLPSPASGLIGRQRELMRIGTQLIEEKKPLTVTLHGAGGIGKTALLWQSLLRFAPSFDLTLALALDPLPSLESILGRIERFLGLPSPCANETKERETLVRERLTSKRTLLGLDNFETLNYALNEKDSEEEKTSKSLYSFFESLAAHGVTLCVTSREVTNLPGETIEDIQGLTNENGGRLFQENVVRQKDEIYIEKTQQVSEMVGGHPLALRLLASAFDDQVGTSLDQYIEDLQSHLPKARDKWTEEDRHESLRASFDFTMRNLVKTEEGKELQVALSRLSVFISFFADFTAAPIIENHFPNDDREIEQMTPKSNFVLNNLWKFGLIERVNIEFAERNPYIYRIHSVITPFAKELVNEADVQALGENYRKTIEYLLNISEQQIFKSPYIAQLALRNLPDLLFLAKPIGRESDAVIQNRVATLIYNYGLYDESIKMFEKALLFVENSGYISDKAILLHNLASLQTRQGDLNGALESYQQSLKINRAFDSRESEIEISKTYAMMAEIYVLRSNLDEAMGLYQKSLATFESHEDLNGKAIAQLGIARIFAIQNNWDNSVRFAKNALDNWNQLGNTVYENKSLFIIGQAYVNLNDFENAIKTFKQVLEVADKFEDLETMAGASNELAGIFFLLDDLGEAIKFNQQALDIFEKLGSLYGKSTATLLKATIKASLGELDDAMNLCQQSLDIAQAMDDLIGQSGILTLMGHISIKRNQILTGFKYYLNAWSVLKKVKKTRIMKS